MKSVRTLALMGASCFALALSGMALAQSSIGAPSTPAEKAQTQTLNQSITDANADIETKNAAIDAKNDQNNADYQAQQLQYQEQLTLYRASKANYEVRAARYEASRDRYIAANARYRRGAWPSRYEHNIVVYTTDLLGANVQTANGHPVGHVEELSLASGHVDAVRVTLDRGLGDVWIQAADLRFDANKKIVMTDLNRNDLRLMSHDSF